MARRSIVVEQLHQRIGERTIKKRCAKCGNWGYYRDSQRNCRHHQRVGFGKLSTTYLCWGALSRVVRKRREEDILRDANGNERAAGAYLNDQAEDQLQRQRGLVARLKAVGQLAKVNARINDKTRQIARLTKQLAGLQTKSARLTKRAAMTDDQIEAERQKTIAAFASRKNKPRSKRAIALDGKVEP